METNASSRNMAVMSYLPLDRILQILEKKADQIKGYLYILHDKDKGVPHYHLVIRLKQTRKPDEIKRWFKADGINTFAQSVYSKKGMLAYLNHSNRPEKYQYPLSEIVNVNGFESLEDEDNEPYEMYMDCFNNMLPRNLVKKYGRDFLFHSGQVYNLVAVEKGLGQDIYFGIKEAVRQRATEITLSMIDSKSLIYNALKEKVIQWLETDLCLYRVAETEAYDSIYNILFDKEIYNEERNV